MKQGAEKLNTVHMPVSLLGLFCSYRINAVSNGQVRGDSYSEGCLGQTGK